MSAGNYKENIRPGLRVRIEEKSNQGTGNLTEGIVKEILTNSKDHPYGIKVRLEGGLEGRVKEILDVKTSKQEKTIHSGIEQKLLEGEGSTLEYKSSFKFDLKRFTATGTKTMSKIVEKEIPIAVSALANANGGIVLIGVGDRGESIGIHDDIELMSPPTRELFQRQLWQTLKDLLKDNAFVSTLKVRFHNIEEKEICEIEVPPSFEPVFVHDNMQESYVRLGNRSEKFEPSDFIKYCSKRFVK